MISCDSIGILTETGFAEEAVPYSVFTTDQNGNTKAIGSGMLPTSAFVGSSPIGSDASFTVDGTGQDGHAPDTGYVYLAGTSDSSVTIIAGASFVSTAPQNPQPNPNCITNAVAGGTLGTTRGLIPA